MSRRGAGACGRYVWPVRVAVPQRSEAGPGPQPALNYGQAARGCAARGNGHAPPGATGAQWSPFPIEVVLIKLAGRGLGQGPAASLSPAFRGDVTCAAPCQSTGWAMHRLCKPLKHKSGVSIPNCKHWGPDRGQGALQPLGCPSEQVGDAGVSSLGSGTH